MIVVPVAVAAVAVAGDMGAAPPSVMSSDEQGRCLIPDGYGYVPWMHANGSYVFCTVYIQSTYSLHYSLH